MSLSQLINRVLEYLKSKSCFATLANAQACEGFAVNAIQIGPCPPTIITINNGNIPTTLFGCQSGGFTTVVPPETNNVFLQIPPNCGGCYNIELNISGFLDFPDEVTSGGISYFGVCRSGETDFLIPPAILVIASTAFEGLNPIPINVSTSATVCLQAGDLIAPCAASNFGTPLLAILGLTMKVVKLGDCEL